jgi:hypothetical protein
MPEMNLLRDVFINFLSNKILSQVWWYTPEITAFRRQRQRQRQEDVKFKANLSYTARPYPKKI